jgi:hypothetical protein
LTQISDVLIAHGRAVLVPTNPLQRNLR